MNNLLFNIIGLLTIIEAIFIYNFYRKKKHSKEGKKKFISGAKGSFFATIVIISILSVTPLVQKGVPLILEVYGINFIVVSIIGVYLGFFLLTTIEYRD